MAILKAAAEYSLTDDNLEEIPSAKWGMHTYAEYAKSEPCTILQNANGFT
jgi:hypothetical protein